MKHNDMKTSFRTVNKNFDGTVRSYIEINYYDEKGEDVSYSVVPYPIEVQFINDKITKVFFSDGTYEKATLVEDTEAERREGAVAICLLKKLLEPCGKNSGYGNNVYNKYIEVAFRETEKKKKMEESAKRELEDRKERNLRRAEKKKRKAERRLRRRFDKLYEMWVEKVSFNNDNSLSQAYQTIPCWDYTNVCQNTKVDEEEK